MSDRIEVQDTNNPGQVPIDKLLSHHKWGSKSFAVQNINAMCSYTISISPETGYKYLHIFVNGQRTEDFFVQVPVLKKEGEHMMFMNMKVGKDSEGWRILD